MIKIINSQDQNFTQDLNEILAVKSENLENIALIAGNIIKDIKLNKEKALLNYTRKFERHDNIFVSEEEINQAFKKCDDKLIKALELAAARIYNYHIKQLPEDFNYEDEIGVKLGNLWRPINKIGVYIPGGLANYPSSVLMNAIPAKVAGVKNITGVVPAPDNILNPAILVAAKIANIDKIYKIGGAQAIAALAYGTENIAAVDKIVGPGNAYVAAAKKIVYGDVGIDMVAGPSEILVVSDNKTNPGWVAADLLSQAEHDKMARVFLICDDPIWAGKVVDHIKKFLAILPKKDIAKAALENNSAIIITDKNPEIWVNLINKIAPEHLELALDEELIEEILPKIRNSGAIFAGRYTPEAIGDYIAGPSHVLPTSSTSRFSSGLSVYDFLKRISYISCNRESFNELADATELLAVNENLQAHALSVYIRKNNSNG